MLRCYPSRKWLWAAAGQHPGVPGSGEWGSRGGAGKLGRAESPRPESLAWGTGEDVPVGGLGDRGRRERESRGTLGCQRAGVHERGRGLQEEVRKAGGPSASAGTPRAAGAGPGGAAAGPERAARACARRPACSV